MIRTLECPKALPLYPVFYWQMKSDFISFICVFNFHDIPMILSRPLPRKRCVAALTEAEECHTMKSSHLPLPTRNKLTPVLQLLLPHFYLFPCLESSCRTFFSTVHSLYLRKILPLPGIRSAVSLTPVTYDLYSLWYNSAPPRQQVF